MEQCFPTPSGGSKPEALTQCSLTFQVGQPVVLMHTSTPQNPPRGEGLWEASDRSASRVGRSTRASCFQSQVDVKQGNTRAPVLTMLPCPRASLMVVCWPRGQYVGYSSPAYQAPAALGEERIRPIQTREHGRPPKTLGFLADQSQNPSV